MKINNILKILFIILITFMLLTTISNATNKSGTGGNSKEQSVGVGGIDIDTGALQNIYGNQDSTFNTVGGRIIGVVSYICYGAALIILIIKGVQFMSKSPEGKAELKKELISYTIGAVIVFAIGAIIQLIGKLTLKIF